MTTEATETLLDRDAELAALRRTLADAPEGRGRLVIVEGEARIGKTALLGRAGGAATSAMSDLSRLSLGAVRRRAGPLAGAACAF